MANFSVSPILSDGMIIQRDVETSIWGEAADGSTVTVAFAGQSLQTAAKDGKWQMKLPAVPAGPAYEMTITSGAEKIVIKEILAGEVWIAGGQSNMEWPLKNSVGGKEAIASANHGQIRNFNVQKVLYTDEVNDNPAKFSRKSAWRAATSDNAGEFSAVAYHFAIDLHEKLGVPVGIIDCNLGGSSASAWTSEAWLAKDPDVRSYLDDYNRNVSQLDLEAHNRNCASAMQIMTDNPMPVDPEKESEIPFDFFTLPADMLEAFMCAFMSQGPRSPFGHPGSLYENMLSTFIPYSAKGVIFYQGESDDVKARIYAKLFSLMISNWREAFANEDLHFLFVQLAAYGREGNPDGDMYAILRDQQTLVSQAVRYTGMAVAMDVGHFHDIHPRRKMPVGKRLALIAREKVYGEQVESSGPVYRSMQVTGNKIVLAFDHATNGLTCKGDELQGFRICGPNRLYVSADARIIGSTVELSSPAVPVPAAASYGWANYMEVNLYNAEGLPAVPFKTDKYL